MDVTTINKNCFPVKGTLVTLSALFGGVVGAITTSDAGFVAAAASAIVTATAAGFATSQVGNLLRDGVDGLCLDRVVQNTKRQHWYKP